MNIAIILASGDGERYGINLVPKHLIPLKGIPIIVWNVKSIILSKVIDYIVIVTKKKSFDSTRESLDASIKKTHYQNIKLVEGAPDRMNSFLNGLRYVEKREGLNDGDNIFLFDANRPLVNPKQIQILVNESKKFGAACLGRPIVNGIANVKNDQIFNVPTKEDFFEIVTPEVMNFYLLRDSLEVSNKKLPSLVDYAINIGIKPKIVPSNDLNTKLTYPEDKFILEALIEKNNLETLFYKEQD